MKETETPRFAHDLNLADTRLGTSIVRVTDEWFAEARRMLEPSRPEWREGVYDENGKWMDGWESRRKRVEGFDHAVIKLGIPGFLNGCDIDTSFFTGNYPPSASIEACFCEGDIPGADAAWSLILPAVSLQGNSHHLHAISAHGPFTHVRFNIFPDGGVARLRLFGSPFCDWANKDWTQRIDLASVLNGGRAVATNNEHFGKKGNILNPGRGVNMGDGWETARRRTPGNDWVIVALAHAGVVESVLVDTLHFKGNYPDRCSIQAAYVHGGTDDQIETQSLFWRELLAPQKLHMNQEHHFKTELEDLGTISHVRLNIFPDGGVSRLRLFGFLR